MAIHLMDNESIVWRSHQGKNYRRFFLIRDLLLTIIVSVLIFYSLNTIITLSNKKMVWIITGLVFVIGIIVMGIKQFTLLMSLYIITTERVIIKRGWLNRRLTSIKLENIIDTKAEQSFAERLIKTGTIYLFTANDSHNSDEKFIQNVPEISNIDYPFKRHAKIVKLLKQPT